MPLREDWLNLLFVRLLEIYGERFTPLNHDEVYRTILRTALDGLQPDDFRLGLAVCQHRKYMPLPSPIEFWHWCKGIKYEIKRKR